MIGGSITSSGRMLLATEVPFWRGDSGAGQRIAGLCRCFVQHGYTVRVFYPGHVSASGRAMLQEHFPGVTLQTPSTLALLQRAVRRRLGAMRGETGLGPDTLPTSLRRPWIHERVQAFRHCCASFEPHVLIIEYLTLAYLLDGLEPAPGAAIHTIIDTIDVLSARAQRFVDRGEAPPLAITPSEEASALSRFDTLLAIQDEEAALLRSLCPEKSVVTVGHAVAVEPIGRGNHPVPRALFFGGVAQHNRLALEHLRALWPEVRAQVSNAELIIAGGISTPMDADERLGIRVHGPVDAPRDAYALADVVVNPALVGSGLKIKNVEALAHGMPLVTTAVGAEGMSLGAGRAFLQCDTPESMVNTIVALLLDASARDALSKQALAFAREHLSSEAAYGPLLDILRSACYRDVSPAETRPEKESHEPEQ